MVSNTKEALLKGSATCAQPASSDIVGGHQFAQAWRNENLGRAMFEATRRFEGDAINFLAGAGYPMIRPAHLTLFRHLDLEGTRLVDLAFRANMTKQGMQDLVDKLERLGIVERRPDPNDRRAKFVMLSVLGLEIFDAVRRAVLDADMQMTKIVGEEGLAEIIDVLGQYAHR